MSLHLVVQAAITLAPCCLDNQSSKSIRENLSLPFFFRRPIDIAGAISVLLYTGNRFHANTEYVVYICAQRRCMGGGAATESIDDIKNLKLPIAPLLNAMHPLVQDIGSFKLNQQRYLSSPFS